MKRANRSQSGAAGGPLNARLIAIRRRVRSAVVSNLAAVAGGLLVVVYLATYSLAPMFTVRPTAGAPEAAFKSELDRSVPKILSHFHVPGMVIATVVNGIPSHTYAYGFADISRHRAMRPDTVFRVASISKSLTAWGVVRLVDAGQIDLDAPAQSYLPVWPLPKSPFPSSALTIRRLLNHTSGLNSGGDTFRPADQPPISAAEVLRTPMADAGPTPLPARLAGPADQSYAYSVPGYALLQMVVEAKSGQPFVDYMHSAVLQPLGMVSSSYAWDPALRDRTATPYLSDGQPSPVLIPQDQAADSLFSTAPDLARFVAAPLPDPQYPAGAGVLRPSSVPNLYQSPGWMPRIGVAGLGIDLPALGCFVENLGGGRELITNGGYDPGWSSQFFLVPSTGDGLVILTNSEDGQPAIAEIAATWSQWRGLPPTMLTLAYKHLGATAALALGLLAAINVSFWKGLVSGVARGGRRFGRFSPTEMAAGCVECMLAICIMWLWMLEHARVQTLPSFDLVGTVAIRAFVLVTILRLLFPHASGRRASSREASPAAEVLRTGYAG